MGDVQFSVGDDSDGYSVRLPMGAMCTYIQSTRDRNPLYVFDDSCFDDDDDRQLALRKEFEVPSIFSEDLFQYLPGGEANRFAYRWLLGGPPRSGTAPHIDPLGVSAWN